MKSIIKRLFCQHNYELINQNLLISEFEIICENGFIPNTWCSKRQKLITDYKCTNCGKIKRLKEKTIH